MWPTLLAPDTLALGTKFGSQTVTVGAVSRLVWLVSVLIAGWTGPAPAKRLLRTRTCDPRRCRR